MDEYMHPSLPRVYDVLARLYHSAWPLMLPASVVHVVYRATSISHSADLDCYHGRFLDLQSILSIAKPHPLAGCSAECVRYPDHADTEIHSSISLKRGGPESLY